MLVAEPTNIDLGKIKFGQAYTFSYKVTNQGNLPIKIGKLLVSCSSCTTASIKKSKLQPNESDQVKVTFIPGTLSVHKKWVDILYENKSLRLSFTGDSNE